tara:strand:+ start:13266 stop:15059 length:1794 start_codon:yes stop_codon:yes gene_type:complete
MAAYKLTLDKKILNQNRFIPWVLSGKKKIPIVGWSNAINRKPFHEIKGKVGIVFDKEIDNLAGLDLDDCINPDGTYTIQAAKAVDLFTNIAYIERSVSGKGLHFIFYSDLNISFNLKPIEYYSTGRYFTISGDSLPESSPTIQDCSKEIRTFIQQFAPEKLIPKVKTTTYDNISLTPLSKIKEVLSQISSDCNRGDWFTVACSLHHEFEQGEDGFDLFNSWSANSSDKYQGEEDCRNVWDSLGGYSGPPITISSLFNLATKKEIVPWVASEGKKRWFTTADLNAKLGPIEWLVKDYFEANTISIIWGDTMAFKSFLALEVCFCIAAARSWHGKEVKQGAVLYVCGEGANGIARRITGLRQKYGITQEIPLYVSNGSRDMIEAEAVTEVIDFGNTLETNINMVMIDTVNRNFSGEENSSKDVAKAYKHLDRIKEAFNCSIAMVHHTGKSGTTIRGSAAWVQNVDASYEMKRSSNTFYTQFIPRKMKDAALGEEINFEMKEIILNEVPRSSTVLTTLISKTIDEIPISTNRRKDGGITHAIFKCLEEKDKATTKKEIEDWVYEDGQPIDSIRTTLTRMVERKEIIRSGRGLYELPKLNK